MRKSIFVLALSTCAAAGLIVAAWLFLPDLAKNRLDAAGFGEVDYGVDRFSLEQLVLSNIRFGRDQTQRVDRLTVLFHPMRLLRRGSVDSVSVEGADLHFVSRHDGVPRLAGVSLPEEPDAHGESRIPAIPARRFNVKDSVAHWETDRGVLRIPLKGVLTQTDSRSWSLHGGIGLHFGEAHANLAVAGRLEPDGTAHIEVDLSKVEGGPRSLPQIRGNGKIEVSRDSIGKLSGFGKLELESGESRLIVDAQADTAETAESAISFVLNLNATDLDMAALGELSEYGGVLKGGASGTARLAGTLPVNSRPKWHEMTASGRISLEVVGADLEDLITDASGRLDVDLSFSGAPPTAAAVAPRGLTGHVAGNSSPASDAISGIGAQRLLFASKIDLTRSAEDDGLDLLLASPARPLMPGTAFERIASPPVRTVGFDLYGIPIGPTSQILRDTQTSRWQPSAPLVGTGSHVEGWIDAKIDISGTFAGDNRLAGAEAELQGRFVFENGELIFLAEDCISLKGKRLDLGPVRFLRPFELCASQPGGKPLLRLEPSGAAALEMTLPTQSVALALGNVQSPTRMVGTLPEVALSAALDGAEGSSSLALTTQGGSLELTEHAVALSDIELSLTREKSTSLTLTRAVARSLSKPPQFPVVILSGNADGRLDGAVSFKLAARGQAVPIKLSANGKHDFKTAIGEMSYELDKIRFSPDGIQPGDVFPAFGRMIERARGSLASSGGISWVAGVPAGYSRLMLDNLGFDAPGLRVRGINSRLKRASKTVRNRIATQEIRVDLLDIGAPLRNGLIRFHTRKAPSIRIEKIRFSWGGGTLQTEPFDVRVDRLSAEHAVVLNLDEVQLEALLELIPIDGLQGTGTLSGRVPLRIRGSQVTIGDGSVSANAPGVLRYRPAHKPAFFGQSSNTELLFKALNNFHYESLAIGLNGKSREDLQLSISLSGANPDLYDGHPFKLNFNVTGELDTIIRRALFAAELAENLGKLMSTYLQ